MTTTLTAPPRAKRRTGKLAPITRSQAAAFNAAVLSLMAAHPVHADRRTDPDGYIAWRLVTPKVGPVIVALYPKHEERFSVLFGLQDRSARHERDFPGIHRYSGAWNVACPQAEEALTELRTKLAACGVV